MNILNLTQHYATPSQNAEGVFDLHDPHRAILEDLLTFTKAPSKEEMEERAERIATLAFPWAESMGFVPTVAMIGGANWFMPYLTRALIAHGITPQYSFTLRESLETIAPDGSTRKSSVFRHIEFIPAT